MTTEPRTAKEIFVELVGSVPPDEWDQRLGEACHGDDQLERRVRSLLRAHVEPGSFMEQPVLGEATVTPEPPISECPGTTIGPYKLREQIGEGGMGVVYVAEQTEPVKRKVALKLIKPGMDTRQVVARFEAERQALAMMDHPNIAKVFDAGATGFVVPPSGGDPTPENRLKAELPTGRPYFVMELIQGLLITEYCDQRGLSTRERLQLFLQVCRAVEHAHQKGIMHRDLKPSNVLVSEIDGTAVPKVIDFGVAKAVNQELTEQTLYTQFAQMVGTPLYMSPEQAGLGVIDVDTRSDIYSLGVLLYELLTGTTPFNSETLKQAGFDEMRRIIREDDPPKPSARVSTLNAQALSTVAQHRGSDPRRLSASLARELDWIVMKAMEKDRGQRYQTASGFGKDVERYLADEAVEACPPSRSYRLKKFVRRNKGGVGIAVALLLSVLLILVGLFESNRWVNREKKQTEAALARAVHEKGRADENLAQARKAVKEYLLKTSESPVLQSSDFYGLRKELLETAIPFYLDFVRQRQADPELEAERGLAYEDLAFLRQETGDQNQALQELAQAESIFRGLREAHPEWPSYRQRLAETLNSRGIILHDLSRFDEAERAFRESLVISDELAQKQPTESEYRNSVARINNNLGNLLRDSGRLDHAEAVLRKAISIREELISEQPEVLELRGQVSQAWLNLGSVFHAQQLSKDAERAYLKAIEALDQIVETKQSGLRFSSNYEQIRAESLNNIGILYRADGRLADAEQAFQQALVIKQQLAEEFPSVPQFRQELARSHSNLGLALSSLDRPEKAQAEYEKSIGIYERLSSDFRYVPAYAVEVAGTYGNLGRLLGDQGHLEESLPILTKSVEMLEAAFQQDERVLKVRESLLVAHWTRAMTLARLGRFADALPDWGRAIELDDGQNAISLRLKRASNFLQLKNHASAVVDVEAVLESSAASHDDLFLVACAYAVSAQLAKDDPVLAESYAARAVLTLRQAIDKGADPVRIKTNQELDGLRSRDDFKSLMDEVADEPLQAEVDRPK